MSDSRPSLDEIRQWPPTVSVEAAAAVYGFSRASAYEYIRLGKFPARTLKVGGRRLVLTDSILASLAAA